MAEIQFILFFPLLFGVEIQVLSSVLMPCLFIFFFFNVQRNGSFDSLERSGIYLGTGAMETFFNDDLSLMSLFLVRR